MPFSSCRSFPVCRAFRKQARPERPSATIALMSTTRQFTAIIEREDDMYVALCPEFDIVSQGPTIEQARATSWGPLSCSSSLQIRPRSRTGSTRRSSSPVWRWRLGRLRRLSGRDACRLLEANGFVRVRQRGSHIVMQKRCRQSTTTPFPTILNSRPARWPASSASQVSPGLSSKPELTPETRRLGTTGVHRPQSGVIVRHPRKRRVSRNSLTARLARGTRRADRPAAARRNPGRWTTRPFQASGFLGVARRPSGTRRALSTPALAMTTSSPLAARSTSSDKCVLAA